MFSHYHIIIPIAQLYFHSENSHTLTNMPIDAYLAQIILPLCHKPDAVKIAASTDQMGVLLTVTVDKADMGVVIGKSGETAKAIRHLVRIAGIKASARVSVKINEPDGTPYKGRMSDKELLES